MPARIRDIDPVCSGRSVLAPADVKLYVDNIEDPLVSVYKFICQVCEIEVEKQADSRVRGLLQSGGVEMVLLLSNDNEQLCAEFSGLLDQITDDVLFQRISYGV